MTLVNIVEHLPDSDPDVRVIVRGVEYDLGVATCRYLGRPSLDLVYVETGRVASWDGKPNIVSRATLAEITR